MQNINTIKSYKRQSIDRIVHNIILYFLFSMKNVKTKLLFYSLNNRGLCSLSSDVMYANGGNLMLISG